MLSLLTLLCRHRWLRAASVALCLAVSANSCSSGSKGSGPHGWHVSFFIGGGGDAYVGRLDAADGSYAVQLGLGGASVIVSAGRLYAATDTQFYSAPLSIVRNEFHVPTQEAVARLAELVADGTGTPSDLAQSDLEDFVSLVTGRETVLDGFDLTSHRGTASFDGHDSSNTHIRLDLLFFEEATIKAPSGVVSRSESLTEEMRSILKSIARKR